MSFETPQQRGCLVGTCLGVLQAIVLVAGGISRNNPIELLEFLIFGIVGIPFFATVGLIVGQVVVSILRSKNEKWRTIGEIGPIIAGSLLEGVLMIAFFPLPLHQWEQILPLGSALVGMLVGFTGRRWWQAALAGLATALSGILLFLLFWEAYVVRYVWVSKPYDPIWAFIAGQAAGLVFTGICGGLAAPSATIGAMVGWATRRFVGLALTRRGTKRRPDPSASTADPAPAPDMAFSKNHGTGLG